MIRALLAAITPALLLASTVEVQAQDALPNEKAWSAGVDLLRLIDPVKDALEGKWAIQEAKLVSVGTTKSSKLQIMYHPPREYDFRIVYTGSDTTSLVCQIFSQSEHMAMWVIGNGMLGIDMVAGQSVRDNKTTVTKADARDAIGNHTSVLQVRRKEVRAYLDGKLVNQLKTDFTDLSLHSVWEFPNHRLLGVVTKGPATFQRIDLIEVTGKGSIQGRRR